jgi:hypothetical protein
MRKLAILALLLGVPAMAAEFSGYLMDTMCSSKMKDSASGHTAQCAKSCAGSGFGIVDKDGAYLKFDEAGNRKALTALNATAKKDTLMVKVVGEKDGEMIKKVDSITFQ